MSTPLLFTTPSVDRLLITESIKEAHTSRSSASNPVLFHPAHRSPAYVPAAFHRDVKGHPRPLRRSGHGWMMTGEGVRRKSTRWSQVDEGEISLDGGHRWV